METIKCISLWQPWSSLCCIPHPDDPARSVKGFETRPWSTRYRGSLLIHAAKRFTNEERAFCHEPIISESLRRVGYRKLIDIPRGAIVGIVDLVDVHPTEPMRLVIDDYARAMGNYSGGRYAWEIVNPNLFGSPIPYRGQQGLFDVPLSVIQHELVRP